ncbi:MAG: hypothetical protein NTY98_15785, partial [Verrucomicrobia bacterium]|nr:hypothetical protein [Verrucomicrobiota bacterium]
LTALPMRPADPQDPPFPVVEPIPMKEGALLEKDFAAAERDWGRRLLLQPAQQRWKGQPWADEASALVDAVLEQFEKDHVDELALAPLAGRFRELLKKTSDDPLLLVFGAHAIFSEKQDWRESRPLVEKALAQPGLSGAQEMMAVYVRWLVANMEGADTDELQQRWLNAMERSLTDGSYDEASHVVLVRHHIMTLDSAKPKRAELLESYSRSVEASKLPEWAQCTLRGKTEKELAWVKRGSDWANNVNDTQWKGFAEHLKSARDLLGRAARLRPDRPEPAGSMISVAMGEGMDLKEMRAWFDRSVSAQFDYFPAYSSMLWAFRPRWGGSHELMLAFGKACAETKRYDTMVPSRLMTAALEVTEELYDPRFAFRHKQVQQAINDMSRGYLEASASQPPLTRHLRQSNAAMCAFLADDDALAQKALNAAGPRLYHSTRKLLNTMFMHETSLRAEVAADTGAYGEAIRTAANPAPKTPLKDIHAAFMKVEEKGLSADALAYLQEGREMTGLQQAVEAGGWVDLHFHKHLTAFYQSEMGEWTVDPDGVLVCHGTDFPRSGLVLKIPLGPDVEMKGEISFDIPATTQKSQYGSGFAPQLHWTPVCTDGVRAMIYHLSENSACTKAYCNNAANSTADIPFPLQEWNSFSTRSADGKFSYDVNGRTMASNRDLAALGLENASGLVGFSAYRLPIGTKVRVRNVSIRKITAAALAPVAATGGAQAETFFIDHFPDWTWKAALVGLLIMLAIFVPRFMPKHEE